MTFYIVSAIVWSMGLACGIALAVVITGLGTKVRFGVLHINTKDPNKDMFSLELDVDSPAQLENTNKVILKVSRD